MGTVLYTRRLNYVAYFHIGRTSHLAALAIKTILKRLIYGVQLLEKEKCCGVAKIANRLIKEAKRDADINMASIRRSVVDENRPVILSTQSMIFFTGLKRKVAFTTGANGVAIVPTKSVRRRSRCA